MKQKKPYVLPRVPSELILIALADIEAVEKQPDQFKFEMSLWVAADGDDRCAVCAAGAVMVNRLEPSLVKEVKNLEYCGPNYVSQGKNYQQLQAINSLRCGDLESAFEHLNIQRPSSLPELFDGSDDFDTFAQESYERNTDILNLMSGQNRAKWKLYMLDLAGILQAEGF